MGKKARRTVLFLVLAAVLAGCAGEGEAGPKDPFIYYMNPRGTALVKVACTWSGDTALEEIEDMLNKMRDVKEDAAEYVPAIQEEVKIDSYTLEGGKLKLYFSQEYADMNKTEEILCRAAVVQSLVQIEGVNFVKFFVNGQPLKNKNGLDIGYMRAEDFVQNTGAALNSYQKTVLTIFYANEEGTKLVGEKENVRYNSNIPVEKVAVEQLIKGPSEGDGRPTIPKEAKLLGVSVRDDVCYVNFDEGFLTEGYDMDPQLVIASLVNSVIECGNASQVQISVNGETNVMFRGTVDLSAPISQNMELLEETGSY